MRKSIIAIAALLSCMSTAQTALAQQKAYQFKFDLKNIFGGSGQEEKKQPAQDRADLTPKNNQPDGQETQARSNTNVAGTGEVRQQQAIAPTKTVAPQTFGEQANHPIASNGVQDANLLKLIYSLPKKYLTREAGLDWSYMERFANKLAFQFRKNGRLLLFPGIHFDRDICKEKKCDFRFLPAWAVTKPSKDFGVVIMSSDPETDSRFDKEMSLVAGISYELGDTGSVVKRNPEMAARWYERSLNQSSCTDAGSVQPYPCEISDVVAKSRLAFLCISGQACTNDVNGNKSEWISKGIAFLQPLVGQVEAWYKSGGNPDDPILNDVHNFAIFLPSDIQLKIALVRAEKVRRIYLNAGAVRPYPDWRNLAKNREVNGDDVLCTPKDADIPGLKDLMPRNPFPPISGWTTWHTNWFDLAAAGGSTDAIRITEEMESNAWADRESRQIQSLNDKWEHDMAGWMKAWRKRIRPGLEVRPKNDGEQTFRIAKISGSQAVSDKIPIRECGDVINETRRNFIGEEVIVRDGVCQRWDVVGYRTKTEDISELFPNGGYDSNGLPVDAGGSRWVGKQRKTVDGQRIEVSDGTDCETIRKLQSLWAKKYK